MTTWPSASPAATTRWWHVVLWPISLLVVLLVIAGVSLVRRWWVIALALVIGFVVSFLALMIMPSLPPAHFNTDDAAAGFRYLVRWWNRLGHLGTTHVLSSAWIGAPARQGHLPNDKNVFTAFWHVALAGSLVLTGLVALVIAIGGTVRTVTRPANPFDGGV